MGKVEDRAQVTEALAGVPYDWQQLSFQSFGRAERPCCIFRRSTPTAGPRLYCKIAASRCWKGIFVSMTVNACPCLFNI
ncbi:hypothetical protein [Microbulbifer halophilus]